MSKISIRFSEEEEALLRQQAEVTGVSVLAGKDCSPRASPLCPQFPATAGQVAELAGRVAALSEAVGLLVLGREKGAASDEGIKATAPDSAAQVEAKRKKTSRKRWLWRRVYSSRGCYRSRKAVLSAWNFTLFRLRSWRFLLWRAAVSQSPRRSGSRSRTKPGDMLLPRKARLHVPRKAEKAGPEMPTRQRYSLSLIGLPFAGACQRPST